MDAERIFHEAVDITDPEQQATYLDGACAGDDKLRSQVEALLRADARAGSFLESPPAGAGVTMDQNLRIDGPGTVIGRYELLELIGEGGMGLVYLAEQKEPIKRRVALKIIKPGMDSRQVVARFEAERQTLAQLDHPNVAHVFDAGCTETGRPYFVMEYVKGLSITCYCDDHRLTIEQRLRLFEQVCEAVHHAHQKGIIHRDLKPSNILVCVHDDRAVPKIIDFGIAKAITQPLTDTTFVTFQGQLLGTPEYMSPEQVDLATQDVDTRTDIYSLGVILYELLAGVLPFESDAFERAGLAEIQQTIREMEPASPSLRLTTLGEKAKTIAASRGTQVLPLARRLHRELEWIPLKAMRKDRCRRYRSVSEMADDIRNYLTGLPLLAGPETTIYRAQKFVRKHAGSVTSVALVAVVMVLGFITSTVFSFRAETARGQEAAARTEAEQARDKEVALRTQVEQALVRAEKVEKVAQEQRKLAEESAENYRRSLYVNSIQLADAKYREGNIGNVRKLLESCPQDLRGWEWDRINHVLDQSLMTFTAHSNHVYSLALSPDGKRLVTGGVDRTLKVWDITTGKELATRSGAHTGYIYRVAFSPDGKHIVSSDSSGEIKVWDAADVNEAITSIRHGSSWVASVSFSPDGKRIVSTSYGEEASKVWDAATGAEILAFSEHKGEVWFAAFSPNGRDIISAGYDGRIKIWDSVSGDVVTSVTGHDHVIRTISFNSDGSLFASGSLDKTIKIWNATTGSLVITLRGHDGAIESVAFSPDDKYVISASWDSTVRIWDIATGEEMKSLRGHEGIVSSVVFTPDGKQAVSGGFDGTVKVWDLIVDREVTTLMGHRGMVASIAFSPDGKRLVSDSRNGDITVWDVAGSAEVMTFSEAREGLAASAYYSSIAFSPDGGRIASLGAECAMKFRDAETGAEVATLGDREDKVRCFAFSPDGKRIVSGSPDGKLKLWDVTQGEEIMTWAGGGDRVLSVAFSPEGHRIASCGSGNRIRVWDAASGAELMSLTGDGGFNCSVVFSPDGKRIAATDGPATIIWDAATGKKLKTLRGHGDILGRVAFSPDGRRLVTGSQDGTARVWDSSTGDELLTLRTGFTVTGVAFSPDGKSIAAGTLGKTIMLWESAAPAGGSGPRKTAAAARKMVDQSHETHGLYHDVIDRLEADTTLDEPVRKVALQIAKSRKVEDGEMLAKEGWEIVSSAEKDIDTYKSIVDKAQKVARSEPKNPSILRTLGVGQYRVGAYAEALETLTSAEKMRTGDHLEPDPNSAAFLAMTQYRLGRVDEAQSTLEGLRALLKDERFVKNEEAKALLAEAEGLIKGKQP